MSDDNDRTPDDAEVEDFDPAGDGTVIALVSTTSFPAEIFAIGPPGDEPTTSPSRRLTHVNDHVLENKLLPTGS